MYGLLGIICDNATEIMKNQGVVTHYEKTNQLFTDDILERKRIEREKAEVLRKAQLAEREKKEKKARARLLAESERKAAEKRRVIFQYILQRVSVSRDEPHTDKVVPNGEMMSIYLRLYNLHRNCLLDFVISETREFTVTVFDESDMGAIRRHMEPYADSSLITYIIRPVSG